MGKLLLLVVLVVSVIQSFGMIQVQMPEAAELIEDEPDLQSQIRDLQKNVTDIWAYLYELKSAVSGHLKHLRVHQEELESSVHRMEHLHDGLGSHHHSGEHHSHGDDHAHDDAHGSDHHSHSDDHVHGSDHQSHSDDHSHGSEHHSHSDDHSHGSEDHSHSDDHHSHGSEHHSRGDYHSHGSEQHSHADDHSSDHHSHGDDHTHGADAASYLHSHGDDHSHGSDHGSEHHGHSGEHNFHSDDHGHHSHSESHSHTTHDHSKEDHSHGSDHPDHKDSHETEDFSQQTQKVDLLPGPVSEPVVVATNANSRGSIHPAHRHHGHDHHGHNHQGHSHGQGMEGRRVQPTSSTVTTNRMDLMSEHDFHRHHHHHHSHDKNKNKTVEIPKYADYNLYDFAICSVQPNRALAEDEQQNVGGTITFYQKKSGGPLNIHMKVQGFKIGDHHGHHSDQQTIQQEEASAVPQEEEEQSKGGHKHGFHIHAKGDLSNGCQNTGDHYNPKNVNHGGPHAMNRHVGDLGNIECDEHGVTNILFSDDVASLRGQYSIIGKAAVIHANQDDLGVGGDPESLRTGNAGTRIACCVIQKVEKLPIRYYKAMKTATQYKN